MKILLATVDVRNFQTVVAEELEVGFLVISKRGQNNVNL